MPETPAQQRERILRVHGGSPEEYDLAVKLGYQPESVTGHYLLPAEHPFTIIGNNVIIRELPLITSNTRKHWRRDGHGYNFRARMVSLPA